MTDKTIVVSKLDSTSPTENTYFFAYCLSNATNNSIKVNYAKIYDAISTDINNTYKFCNLLCTEELYTLAISALTSSDTIKDPLLLSLNISATAQYSEAETMYDSVHGKMIDKVIALYNEEQLLSTNADVDYAIIASISGIATDSKFGTMKIGYVPANSCEYAISTDNDEKRAFVSISTESDLANCMTYIDMLSTKTLLSNSMWPSNLCTEVSCISAAFSTNIDSTKKLSESYYQLISSANKFNFEVNGMYSNNPKPFKLHDVEQLTALFSAVYEDLYGEASETDIVYQNVNFIASVDLDESESHDYVDASGTTKTISLSNAIITNKSVEIKDITFNDIGIYEFQNGIMPDVVTLLQSVDYISKAIVDISNKICVDYQTLFDNMIDDVVNSLTSICNKLYPNASYVKTGSEITALNEHIAVGNWIKDDSLCKAGVYNVWKRTE